MTGRRKSPHPRKFRVQVYLTEQEHDRIAELAVRTGNNMAGAVRMLMTTGFDMLTIPARKDTDTGE